MKHSKLKEQMVLKSSTTACCRLRFEEGPVAFHGKQSFFFPPVNPLSISVIKKKKAENIYSTEENLNTDCKIIIHTF